MRQVCPRRQNDSLGFPLGRQDLVNRSVIKVSSLRSDEDDKMLLPTLRLHLPIPTDSVTKGFENDDIKH